MSNNNTVAIIGGGVSGLSTGALLSRKGMRVKLFEANDKLGGSCANTYLDGYTQFGLSWDHIGIEVDVMWRGTHIVG